MDFFQSNNPPVSGLSRYVLQQNQLTSPDLMHAGCALHSTMETPPPPCSWTKKPKCRRRRHPHRFVPSSAASSACWTMLWIHLRALVEPSFNILFLLPCMHRSCSLYCSYVHTCSWPRLPRRDQSIILHD